MVAKKNDSFLNDPFLRQALVYSAVGIGGYYLVVKPLLQKFGLQKNENELAIEQEAVNPNSPFSPNYYKAGPSGTLLLTSASAAALAGVIWNSVGYLYDDYDAVLSVFKQMKTKSQVSFLAEKFQQLYQKDLLNWLVGTGGFFSWPSDRYSAEEVNQIVKMVNKLPNYKV